ncbi:hypothetical protein [Variovorax boronicumulans]|uniref:hypothetical protein n=1 Tax=Variovorax boronicumulans TaxID=436515 RepID=UPI0012E52E1D|nr:hypothetical protein [Variovorax boronicumulans]GER16713.1 hypothetical protein VCH24_17200 [Variovorax boronicumulans]
MTILSRSDIERCARDLAATGASLEESQPFPPHTEHAEVFAQAFNAERMECA